MTSGNFHRLPLSAITVNRDQRQRRELRGIEELAASIAAKGLMHPIVVTREGVLVAGERRLTAHQRLGLPDILVHYTDEIDPLELQLLELEENTKRIDLTWQEQVDARATYHRLRKAQDPEWNLEDSARELAVDKSVISQAMTVADAIARDPSIAKAETLSTAHNAVKRRLDRQRASLMETEVEQSPTPISCADFTQWASTYSGPAFNFIHCDFPYGINAGDFPQGSADSHGGYDDSPEVYKTLCRALGDNIDRLAAPSCHIMFWYSMKHYHQWTIDFLESIGFKVNPLPLIWYKNDNSGVIPDPQRGPRQVYETALIGSRGDRKIIKPVANCFPAPIVRGNHMSEKNNDMLRFFFSMFVDGTSVVLDPTCGSGSAIRVARRMGARSVTGLEVNPDFAARAQDLWRQENEN